jgi:hypothetical protein
VFANNKSQNLLILVHKQVTEEEQARQEILNAVSSYAEKFVASNPVDGSGTIPPSGKVIGSRELEMMTEAVLDGWLTTGRFNDEFQGFKTWRRSHHRCSWISDDCEPNFTK